MGINWTMSVYRTPGLVPGTWQDSLAGVSAVSFPSGCRVGICGLKLHHGGWSGSSFFSFRLWSEVSVPRFWGNHAFLPSLRAFQLSKQWDGGSQFSLLSPLQSCFFMTPWPVAQVLKGVFYGLGQGWETRREDRAIRALMELGTLCMNEGQMYGTGKCVDLASGR